MNSQELATITKREVRNAEETEIMNNLMTLRQEIKTFYHDLEDSKEVVQTSPGWRYNRKADKLDEKIEAYEITLDSELKTINSKYDTKLEKLDADLEARIKKLREEFDNEKRKIHLDRERGLESKTREYDLYIIKREKEKQSILTDKEKYVENMPKKIHDVRKRRLLRQKIDSYNKNIKRYNEFYKNTPELLMRENWGLEFMVQKGEAPNIPEEKKITTPLSKNSNGVQNIFFTETNSGSGSENVIEKIIPVIPEIFSPPPKKAIKRKSNPVKREVVIIQEEEEEEESIIPSFQPDISQEEEESDSEESVSSIDSYELFRTQYKQIYGEELPAKPEPL